MDYQILASLIGLIAIVSIAVWRFTKVETLLKIVDKKVDHQQTCQKTLVKEIARINVNLKTTKNALIRHLKKEVE